MFLGKECSTSPVKTERCTTSVMSPVSVHTHQAVVYMHSNFKFGTIATFFNVLCEIEQGFSTLRRLVVEDQEKRKRIVATVNFTLH